MFLPIEHKVFGMNRRFLFSPVRIVECFVAGTDGFSGDSVIFDADIFALAVGHDVRLNVVILRIPPEIAVKLTIFCRARITDF